MASISAVIVPAKALKGGRHKIRIAVAHNSETRYIVTDIIIDSAKEFKNGNIVKRDDASYLNVKLRKLLQQCQQRLDEIEYSNCLSCSEVVHLIKNGEKENIKYSLQMLYDETIKCLRSKPQSILAYDIAWKRVIKVIDKDMAAEKLRYSDIILLEKYLYNKKMANASIILTFATLKMVINFGIKNGLISYKINPFVNYTAPKAQPREAWLSVEEIRKIRDAHLTRRTWRETRDLFMLSYYLGGINIADLAKINFKDNPGILKYERQKTTERGKPNKYVEFSIPYEAQEIINRYINSEGKLIFRSRSSDTTRSLSNKVGHFLSLIGEAAGIKGRLIYYSARKSFSQHAYDLGIRDSVIDYILGHSLAKGGSCLYAYRRVTPEIATQAIRQVLDNLK
ncbi:MAG: site-specific integrase [Bacteroidales bacterium]|nr:site-specific integrase [Bacteroidales bacterium]